MTSIEKNIDVVREEIKKAALKANRNPQDIQLVCVTKKQSIRSLNQALRHGEGTFGENRVQELLEKWPAFSKEQIQWHLIGHLQTNKVKYILDKVTFIHSLDRISLAEEISKRAKDQDKIINTLVQVNVADEESKFGLAVNETIDFIQEVSQYPGLKIKGLMTMAPYVENSEEVRGVFKELRLLREKVRVKSIPNVEMIHLSMGMTNDYQVAVEEGATLVRVGSGIFGERIY